MARCSGSSDLWSVGTEECFLVDFEHELGVVGLIREGLKCPVSHFGGRVSLRPWRQSRVSVSRCREYRKEIWLPCCEVGTVMNSNS